MRGFARIGAMMAGAIATGAIATFGLIGAAEVPAAMPPTPHGRRRKISRPAYDGGRSNTTKHARNGDRECERRRRQIAVVSLRHENGLDASVPAFGLTIRQYRQQEQEARAAAAEAWLGGPFNEAAQ